MRRLTAAIFCSAALHLFVYYFGPAWLVYVFKPLTTILTLALAAFLPGQPGRGYRAAIVAGLFFSLAGDIFLDLPGDQFIPGLASFLVAHLCYLAAFVRSAGFRVSLRLVAPFALYFVALMAALLPHLGPLSIPVVVYGIIICVMGWQASERWSVLRTRPSALAAWGAALFIASDSSLAVNRFVRPFGSAAVVTMTTYVAAQWLLARSVGEAEAR